mgnify:CR=1 FL=1
MISADAVNRVENIWEISIRTADHAVEVQAAVLVVDVVLAEVVEVVAALEAVMVDDHLCTTQYVANVDRIAKFPFVQQAKDQCFVAIVSIEAIDQNDQLVSDLMKIDPHDQVLTAPQKHLALTRVNIRRNLKCSTTNSTKFCAQSLPQQCQK